MGDTGPFAVGEKVLVPHTDKFYEAKVQKAQRREDGLWYYFLHYLGWNKKWDEWVEETGLKRPGEATASAAPVGGGSGASAAGPATAGAAAAPLLGAVPAGMAAGAAGAAPRVKSKQRRSGDTRDVLGFGGSGGAAGAAGADSADGQLQIELPPSLQKQLLDQYDAIHEDSKLLQLPRRPNVMQVFQQYVQYVREKQAGVSQAEEDLVAGLQVYFDKALWQCLLFKAERQQADMALAAGQAPSAVYGAEHLLRLIVKLPELLPHTGATGEALQLLIKRVEDLLTYMQIQADRIFLPPSAYVSADANSAAAAAATAVALPVMVKRPAA